MKRLIIYYECDRCGKKIEDVGNPKLMGNFTRSDSLNRRDLKVSRYDYDEEGELVLTPQDFCQDCYDELQTFFNKFMALEATRENEAHNNPTP